MLARFFDFLESLLIEALFAVESIHIRQLVHKGVPVLTCGKLHENDHSIREGLEIVFPVKMFLKHNSREKIDAQRRVDEKQKQDQ